MTLEKKTNNGSSNAGDGFKQLGLVLRSARRSQGLSIKEVSEQLRISVDYLTKLEAGVFDELPAPVYVIGFLRSYGKSVGLDPDAIVARYTALTGGENSKPIYKTPMSMRPPQRPAPVVASIMVLCAGVAYGGWSWLKTDSRSVLVSSETTSKTAILSPNQESTPLNVGLLDTSATVDPEIKNLANTPAMIAAAKNTEAKITPATKELEPELASIQTTVVEPTAFKTAEDQSADIDFSPAQNTENGAKKIDLAAAVAQLPAPSNVETPNLVFSGELAETQMLTPPHSNQADLRRSNTAVANLRDPEKEITIRAVAASWVEIVRDNGEEVMAKLMQAGDSYVIEGNTRLYLSTGNAGGLMVVIGTGDPLSMGHIGEIIRDLPLVNKNLREAL